jgi:16S rRNA processing protein RimM
VAPPLPGDRVIVGRVSRSHGLSGHVLVRPETDNPRRFRTGAVVHAGDRRLEVISTTPVEAGLRVRFAGVDDRTAADALRGADLWIEEEERRSLDTGEYWPEDLVGLEVVDATGTRVGTVSGVVEGVAQDRLVVTGDHGEAEVPFVSELVPEIDVAAGFVRIGDVGGLFTES